MVEVVEQGKDLGKITWRTKLSYLFNLDISANVKYFLNRRKDRWFDKKYGTDTWEFFKLRGNKEYKDQNWPYSLIYQPSLIGSFQLLMESLVTNQMINHNSVFLDVGCGKGLTLMLASNYRFKKIIGVENSPELCEIARNNVELFKTQTEDQINIEVVECDAATFDIPGDADIIYLMNPFNGTILRQFLSNLQKSLYIVPRPVLLIYSWPVYGEVIDETGNFEFGKKIFFDPVPTIIFRKKPSPD